MNNCISVVAIGGLLMTAYATKLMPSTSTIWWIFIWRVSIEKTKMLKASTFR